MSETPAVPDLTPDDLATAPGGPAPPDLTPDKLATDLGGPPSGIPSGVVAVKGWLGPPNDDDIHRLFTDDSFSSFFEIRKDDFVARVQIPDNERDSRDLFWIKRAARVIRSKAGPMHEMEDELWQSDSDAGAFGHPPYR